MVLWCQRSQHFAIAAGEVGGFSICACHPCAFNLTTMSKHNAPLVCYRRGSNIEETGAHWWAISSLPVRSNRPPAAPRLCKEARAVEVVTRRWASELTEDPRRSYGEGGKSGGRGRSKLWRRPKRGTRAPLSPAASPSSPCPSAQGSSGASGAGP